ncbi:MAG: zinc-dependent alcohol dehydrogenase family protein [Bacteroidetes bacterium]|nr:zinc-dependent alcohol dehydrogenase family protein [Bacteroidota bacterium]
MKAMILEKLVDLSSQPAPLVYTDFPTPKPKPNQVLIKVSVCGVCHTELDEIEGRTPPPVLPVVLGHQVVGTVTEIGDGVTLLKLGDRVGVAWIFSACGTCQYCIKGQENLCEQFRATGRDANGGYAQFMVVPENYAYIIPPVFTDAEAAPLLCAGAIGYRSLKLTGLQNGGNLGLTGFGASAHMVLKMAKFKYPQSKISVFARNEKERNFALELGANWAGDTLDEPPEKLDSIIDTTPVWKPIVEGLKHLKSGGRLVINAIRKEDLDKEYLFQLDYTQHLWLEKEIKSVANIDRTDVIEFLALAAKIPIKPEVQMYPLERANEALLELKHKHIRGAKVLKINHF